MKKLTFNSFEEFHEWIEKLEKPCTIENDIEILAIGIRSKNYPGPIAINATPPSAST